MSIPLFKLTIKQNYKLLLIFLAIMSMYVSIIIGMYNPDDIESLVAMFEVVPAHFMSAFGFDGLITNLTTFLASWLYGFIVVIFPTIYCLILANKLVVKTVDNGSMVTLLTTPNSREKILVTKQVYAILSIILLQVYVMVLSIIICNIMFEGQLDISAFIKLNITAGLANVTTMSIAMFFSSICNLTSRYMFLGAGIPLMSLMFMMINGMSKDIEIFKYISYFSWYDSVNLVNGADVLGVNMLYLVIIIFLTALSVYIFKKKNLVI